MNKGNVSMVETKMNTKYYMNFNVKYVLVDSSPSAVQHTVD